MANKSFSRRDFLKWAGITAGASTLVCSGLGAAALHTPAVATPDWTFGASGKRLLVTYATRAGSTVEIAQVIGETLGQRGFSVDVRPVYERPVLDGYKAVLIGSAVRMGSWVAEAVEYVKNNQTALNRLPVALFSVHMNNTGDDPESMANRKAYLDAVRPLLNPVDAAFFAGKIDLSRLSFIDRQISQSMGALDEDRRDWDRIRTWASRVLA
jgi:menaquinone-dependent protoporphyrinogen oxidase